MKSTIIPNRYLYSVDDINPALLTLRNLPLFSWFGVLNVTKTETLQSQTMTGLGFGDFKAFKAPEAHTSSGRCGQDTKLRWLSSRAHPRTSTFTQRVLFMVLLVKAYYGEYLRLLLLKPYVLSILQLPKAPLQRCVVCFLMTSLPPAEIPQGSILFQAPRLWGQAFGNSEF